MRRVVVLGSTGSVGTQTLDVIERLHGRSTEGVERFRVVGLAAGHWSPVLEGQVERWGPDAVAVFAPAEVEKRTDLQLIHGSDALSQLIDVTEPDVVVLATPGLVGLPACLVALRRGKTVAIANKETLVSAGAIVTRAAAEHGGTILPIDSEHCAIWQCLRGERIEEVAQLVLTSSGGAFRDTPTEDLEMATPEQALRHPTWSMGPKITIDSATLMNKGLEIIEASWLFNVPAPRVALALHRQSIVHALVVFADGSVKAQLAVPDMRLPIAAALLDPHHVDLDLPRLAIAELGALTFEPVDERRYPAVALARAAAAAGGLHPAVLNAANEVAVDRFLRREVRFTQITALVAATLDRYQEDGAEVEELFAVDAWARETCRTLQI
ncbi:MAG TPA: 1-deoxy-D-xylulose-5-phosphate reductoisomerase [Chloroflexota bacterium]|nr:1-deoxy-D-xylulose-5-phosphate reductoisomerase [Chloroflexota bacterium]